MLPPQVKDKRPDTDTVVPDSVMDRGLHTVVTSQMTGRKQRLTNCPLHTFYAEIATGGRLSCIEQRDRETNVTRQRTTAGRYRGLHEGLSHRCQRQHRGPGLRTFGDGPSDTRDTARRLGRGDTVTGRIPRAPRCRFLNGLIPIPPFPATTHISPYRWDPRWST